MNGLARRVLARWMALTAGALLKTPGFHEFEVGSGPYGVTIELTVPDPKDLKDKGSVPMAVAIVDVSVIGDWESFEEREDDILAEVSRKLGVRVTWFEGAWGRERSGVRTRHLSIPRR